MINGIIKLKDGKIDLREYQDVCTALLNQFNQADTVDSWNDDSALLCGSLLYNTPESKYNTVPFVGNDNRSIILLWGRLTNRKELAEAIGIKGSLCKIGDSALIYESYKKWGRDFIDHIYGDYSIAIYDSMEKELLCCTDHMGVKPLYYYSDNNIFIFSSSLTLFNKLDFVSISPSLQWGVKFILSNSVDFEKTPYENISKLPPASILTASEKGIGVNKYFAFNGDLQTNESFEVCIEHYRELLERAVASRVNSSYRLGSETSGGIDSSTVTALAAQLFPGSIEQFYTFGFACCEDEPGYILETSQKYEIQNNYICCAIQALDASVTDRYLDAMGIPCEHVNALSHYQFYLECQKNDIRTLLSGFGGDEFVTSIHGIIALKQLLHEGRYKTLMKSMKGNSLTAFLRSVKFYYLHKYKNADVFHPGLYNSLKKRWQLQPVKKEIIDQLELKEDFFSAAKFDAGYTNINKFTLEKRLVPFVPTRMNNCTIMAESYGVDYAWPLLDVRLIEYFLSVPAEYKCHKSMGRYFHRKAADDLVPSKVNWKQGKNMGKPVSIQQNITINSNEDLHPAVASIIDTDKTGQIADDLTNRNRFVNSINELDEWMKKFYPDNGWSDKS